MARWLLSFLVLSIWNIGLSQAQENPPAKTEASPVAGIWTGTLKAGAIELRLVFHIKAKSKTELTGTMDSPDQNTKGIPFESASFEDGKLVISIPKIRAKYEGTLDKSGLKIQGEFHQNEKFPMDLQKVEKTPELVRPQIPKKPYPYLEEEVIFPNTKASIQLAGTLTLPKEKGPFPAVVLISGSGPQDRDGSLLGHKPFLVLADHLTRKGIAVLRCDDRGTGQSKGNFANSTTADFATDAEAGWNYLKTRKEIDPKKIGLVGHSEGAIIAPMIAAENKEIAFIVLLAGPGVSGSEILIAQSAILLEKMGAPEPQRSLQSKIQKALMQSVLENDDDNKIRTKLEGILLDLPEVVRKKGLEETLKAAERLNIPWVKFFIKFDPQTALRKTGCPVFAITGEKDLQVLPKQNLPAIEKALKEGLNPERSIQELPGLNHLFQNCDKGLPSEYGKIEETFAPSALNLISEWILKRK